MTLKSLMMYVIALCRTCLMDNELFAAMKHRSCLVNVARARCRVVDQVAARASA